MSSFYDKVRWIFKATIQSCIPPCRSKKALFKQDKTCSAKMFSCLEHVSLRNCEFDIDENLHENARRLDTTREVKVESKLYKKLSSLIIENLFSRGPDSNITSQDRISYLLLSLGIVTGKKSYLELSFDSLLLGLSNIWNFPNFAIRFGGDLFFFVYFVCLVFVAYPILTLEQYLGNFTKHSAPLAFNKQDVNSNDKKRWSGIGLAAVFLNLVL